MGASAAFATNAAKDSDDEQEERNKLYRGAVRTWIIDL